MDVLEIPVCWFIGISFHSLPCRFELFNIVNNVPEFLLEVGHIQRFPKVGDYSSYCRCVKSERLSDGKKKDEKNKKNRQPVFGLGLCGSSQLCHQVLCGCAKILSTQDGQDQQHRCHQGIE